MLLEALRGYTLVLASITAGSQALPLLSSLPPKIDELVSAARVSPSTASVWNDIKVCVSPASNATQTAASMAAHAQSTVLWAQSRCLAR